MFDPFLLLDDTDEEECEEDTTVVAANKDEDADDNSDQLPILKKQRKLPMCKKCNVRKGKKGAG